MNWEMLERAEQLEQIKDRSIHHPVLIFKHSTRCAISRTVLDRLERRWDSEEMHEVSPFFLDLIRHREVSNLVATEFQVNHESPQVLIIRNGQAVYDASHVGINYEELGQAIANPSS
jgi:bacillithiol system protein YtxJ